MPRREVIERKRRGRKVVGRMLQEGGQRAASTSRCTPERANMKYPISLKEVLDHEGYRVAILSLNSTTSAIDKAPSSRTTAR